jgi:hypothetical protein
VQAGCCRHRPHISKPPAAATATAPPRSRQPSPSRTENRRRRGAGGDRGSHCSLLAERAHHAARTRARVEFRADRLTGAICRRCRAGGKRIRPPSSAAAPRPADRLHHHFAKTKSATPRRRRVAPHTAHRAHHAAAPRARGDSQRVGKRMVNLTHGRIRGFSQRARPLLKRAVRSCYNPHLRRSVSSTSHMQRRSGFFT